MASALQQLDSLLQLFVRNNKMNKYSHLLCNCELNYDAEIKRVISEGLKEDLSNRGDISTLSTIPCTAQSSAYLLVKADGVISGIDVFSRVFKTVDQETQLQWFKHDGDWVRKGDVIANIHGSSQSILTAERLALNLMQRMSGIATQTRKMVAQMQAVKTSKTRLLDTRKTVPGLRVIDKLAVVHGGGNNHRMGLYDMVMIKDNHIAASGGIQAAIDNTHAYLARHDLTQTVKVEIEASTLQEVRQVLQFGAGKVHRIMLDNMVTMDGNTQSVDTTLLTQALQLIGGQFETEASGNITLASVAEVAKTNVDFVSTGSITHSVTALDVSLKFK